MGACHMHSEKLEGALFLFRNEVFDELVVIDVDAIPVEDGNVVIVVVDGDRYSLSIPAPSNQSLNPGFSASSLECGVEAFI